MAHFNFLLSQHSHQQIDINVGIHCVPIPSLLISNMNKSIIGYLP
jgi:hypothetical protein